MKEKAKHYRSICFDACIWLLGGVLSIGIFHARAGMLWLDALVGFIFIALAILVIISPKFRRYMRMQYPGGTRSKNSELIGKYTILEIEINEIRRQCLNELIKDRPSVRLIAWKKLDWDAVSGNYVHGPIYALFPGVFKAKPLNESSSQEGRLLEAIQFEGCLAARWGDQSWEATPILLLGNIDEAKRQLIESF